jgi:ATP-dependent Zn protease
MDAPNPDDLTDGASYLRGMAFHEAGHAVVAWALKQLVGDIYIREIGAGDGGAEISLAHDVTFIDRIAVCLAGIEAGTVFGVPQPSWAGNADRPMAFNLLIGMPEEHSEWLWIRGSARARELLTEYNNNVIRLADRLVEARQVDAAEFLRLMNG